MNSNMTDVKRTHTKPDDWHNKTGSIGFRMCNDYLFRIMMQLNLDILSMLLCALLKMRPAALDIEIQNPIEVGKALGEKEYILDLKVKLNNGMVANVEM